MTWGRRFSSQQVTGALSRPALPPPLSASAPSTQRLWSSWLPRRSETQKRAAVTDSSAATTNRADLSEVVEASLDELVERARRLTTADHGGPAPCAGDYRFAGGRQVDAVRGVAGRAGQDAILVGMDGFTMPPPPRSSRPERSESRTSSPPASPSTKPRPRSPPPPQGKRSRSSSSPTRRLSNTE